MLRFSESFNRLCIAEYLLHSVESTSNHLRCLIVNRGFFDRLIVCVCNLYSVDVHTKLAITSCLIHLINSPATIPFANRSWCELYNFQFDGVSHDGTMFHTGPIPWFALFFSPFLPLFILIVTSLRFLTKFGWNAQEHWSFFFILEWVLGGDRSRITLYFAFLMNRNRLLAADRNSFCWIL